MDDTLRGKNLECRGPFISYEEVAIKLNIFGCWICHDELSTVRKLLWNPVIATLCWVCITLSESLIFSLIRKDDFS